jgi:A/G-specific adenine glycosylase
VRNPDQNDSPGTALDFLLPKMSNLLSQPKQMVDPSAAHVRRISASHAKRVVRWQKTKGRHDLPWQANQDPYRVWLSEIMLQQTQVVTVLDYYTKFLQRFPSIHELARASLDDVLALWSGLGYYSRARNLHACALEVVNRYEGKFPRTTDLLQTLPGIGRSTAAAIASLCFGQAAAILDGNVKRVLSRLLAFDQDLSLAASQRKLWQLAQELLPSHDVQRSMPAYTQGMMDLGATVCVTSHPRCELCPLETTCLAKASNRVNAFPLKSPKKKRTSQVIWMLWARSKSGALWLTKRPTPGVWAGLYCFELFEQRETLIASLPQPYRHKLVELPPVIHALTHKDLHLHPVLVELPMSRFQHPRGQWWPIEQSPALGLPAPVKKMLESSLGLKSSLH